MPRFLSRPRAPNPAAGQGRRRRPDADGVALTRGRSAPSSATTKRISFARLKQQISIVAVLDWYGLSSHLKKRGTQLVGTCPIHRGSNSEQFSVSLVKNVWRCFGDCNRGGSIIDLVAALKNVSLVDAAKLLAERFALVEQNDRC